MAFQLESRLHETREREAAMRGGIVESIRERTGTNVALPLGQFGVEQTGSAGTEKQADAVGPVAVACLRHHVQEAVLRQRQLRQAIVAAVKGCQLRRHGRELFIRHLADPGVEANAVERARRQPRTSVLIASRCARKPTPRLVVTVNALKVRGFNRDPGDGRGTACAPL
jgi:hypothetical protein